MPLMRAFYVALLAPDKTLWQPREPQPATLAVLLTEADYDMADGDPYRLSVQRYNQSSASWEETQTVVDLPWLRVPVTTDALGLFATVAVDDEEDRGSPAATPVEIPPSQPSDLAATGDRLAYRQSGRCGGNISPCRVGRHISSSNTICSFGQGAHSDTYPQSHTPTNLGSDDFASTSTNANSGLCTPVNTDA